MLLTPIWFDYLKRNSFYCNFSDLLIYVYIEIMIVVASLQHQVKYPELPAFLIGYSKTLMWHIDNHDHRIPPLQEVSR